MAFTPEAVWVSSAPNTLARIDPSGPKPEVVFTKTVGSQPTSVVADHGSIWVANQLDGTVTRLDADTGQADATIPVGHGPDGLAATTDVLWVANELGDSVATIDPDTNEVSRTIPSAGPRHRSPRTGRRSGSPSGPPCASTAAGRW